MMVVGCQPLAGESMRWIKDTVAGLGNPHDAAAKNRVSKMEKYVLQGGDVNRPNKLGDTPLHEACAYIRDNGDSSKGKRRKAVTKDRRKVGKKLSHRHLGEGGGLEMLELLINAGSNINAQNIVGDAPLHKAALNGRARSADFLIKAGANVNIRNEFAQTPLHAACVSGNIEVVQRLVLGGADTSAQDAAEDTPFHEACRHQYEGIVIYLMGLVNNPETSEGLKLWQGLDPSWEKILRSRAQAQVEDAEDRDRGEKPATVTTAAATGLSSVRLGVSTPSTTHNSLLSSESAMGLGLAQANRTPVGQEQFTTTGSGGRERGGGGGAVTVSVRGSDQERVVGATSGALLARIGGGGQEARRHSAGGRAAARGAGASSDGIGPDSTGGSRLATRRRRRDEDGENAVGQPAPRAFSTGAADVLNWQATKAKSAQQERLIDKAREALREEQHEAAMAMSSTTLGDDDCSVDTTNTADTPTTIGSRGSRPRGQRVRNGGKVSPAAAAAAAAAVSPADLEAGAPSGFRRVRGAPSRNGTAAAAEGPPRDDARKAATGSPVMPTAPRTGANDGALEPPREAARRQSARRSSSSQAVRLKSPAPRVSRRSSAAGFAKADNVDGSSGGRKSSRRGGGGGGSRGSGDRDRRPEASGSAGDGRDAERSHRTSGGRSSRPSVEHEGHHGHCSSSSAAAAAAEAARPRPRSSRRREGEGTRDNGVSGGGDGGGGERRSPSSRRERSPSSRREKHRQKEGNAAVAGRSSPGVSGGSSSKRGHRSSRGQEGGNPSGAGGGSGSSSRKRESKRQQPRSSHDGVGVAVNGDTGGAASTSAAPAQTPPAPDASSGGAASGLREVPTIVAKAVRVSHGARTPRKGDSLSAHFMSHGTPSRSRDGRPTASSRSGEGEGGATSQRPSEGKEDRRAPSPSSAGPSQPSAGTAAREGKTRRTSGGAGSRPSAKARKQHRSGGEELRPPAWASNVAPNLKEAKSRKKVIASDIPVRRVSPYNDKKQEAPGAGGPALVDTASPKQFFSSPPRSAASRPVAKTMDLRGDKDSDSCCGSSFDPPAVKADVSSSSSASRPQAKPIDVRGDGDRFEAIANSSCCGSSFDSAATKADVDLGSDGLPISEAANNSPLGSSPLKTPTLSVEDGDFPPLIDALMMGKGETAAANGDLPQRSKERTHRGEDKREERVSPSASKTDDRPSMMREIALAKSKSMMFSDSDSDSDNDRSSAGEASHQAASTFGGGAHSIAALSAVLTDAEVERAMEDHADGAASSVFSSSKESVAADGYATAPAMTPPSQPTPPPAASPSPATISAEAAPRAEETAVVSAPSAPDGTGPITADSSAVAGAAAQAVRGKSSGVEPSAASWASAQARSSTPPSQALTKAAPAAAALPSKTTAGGVGAGRGRPSTLGRPGMAPAKVTMPIAGGRAAWNKFLAGTAPGESASDDPGPSTATAEASADGSGGQRADTGASAEGGKGGGGEGPEESDSADEQAEILATRGPRGFKNAADSQEGPNKGPAGAFSGNAMWRLSAGAASAASRARSGVAANGHGGYSNPLAAMRAGGGGGSTAVASGSAADGALGGGGVANPLAGLRGAASMGGAGMANPLARGRGRGAKPGGAGGIANPMLRGGGTGGAPNPLARGSTASGGVLAPGPSVSVAATKSAMPSGGVTVSSSPSLAASTEDVVKAAAAAVVADGVASTSVGEKLPFAVGGALDADGPAEFRAIGSNGSWQKGGIPLPPRRSTRVEPQVEADPGQAKVGGLVMALQNSCDPGAGPMLKDLQTNEDSSSTSSLNVLDRKGLVSLRRAKYSPRHPVPGMPDSNGLDS